MLKKWLFGAPAKFTAVILFSTLVVSVLYSLGQSFISPSVYLVALFLCVVFSVYKLVKWLPYDNMDRRAFVAIDNGITFICIALSLGAILLLSNNPDAANVAMMQIFNYSQILFFITALVFVLAYTYLVGIMIENLVATWRRARFMGVSRWKIILSLPFTFMMFWMPGYFLNDDTRRKGTTQINCKWYSDFTNWVIAKPMNAVIVFIATMVLTWLFVDDSSVLLTILFAVVFGIWVWIAGAKNLRKNMNGAYATTAAVANIILILGIVCYAIFASETETQTISQSVEITTSTTND